MIYWVSMKRDNMVLLRVYPKRGSQGMADITDAEYDRLLEEMILESKCHSLHQVDIADSLAELSSVASLQ